MACVVVFLLELCRQLFGLLFGIDVEGEGQKTRAFFGKLRFGGGFDGLVAVAHGAIYNIYCKMYNV